MERVSWEDAQKFISELNKKSAKKYRLPFEAEWEYACRAGSSGRWYENDLNAIAWYSGNSEGRTHTVGQRKANAFGLHDMLGNVWEWCADLYDSDYYAVSLKDNPQGPEKGSVRVIRGGSRAETSRSLRRVGRDCRAGVGAVPVCPPFPGRT